ncbi:hypothetical protein V6N11_063829 [Hibiscus sabdariffa]|uniref:Uncharacterized protein n=1 Tax=Hibiscus sabdariffa TaxID=183260 RepID=A0ABR2PM36_9ROSI
MAHGLSMFIAGPEVVNMGTTFNVVVLLLFISSILFSVVTASSDGLVRIGLKKMKLDPNNRLASQLESEDREALIESMKKYGFPQNCQLWVPSSKCYFSVSCYFHSKYKASESKTYKKNGKSAAIHYGTGAISSFFCYDHVQVDDLVVEDQVFIEATKEPVSYNMIKQGEELGGEIVFGGVHPNHYRGKHTYVPVAQKGYRQFDMGDVLIGDKPTGYCAGGCAGIADSGASLIAVHVIDVIPHCLFVLVQTVMAMINLEIGASGVLRQPKKICSQIGLCTFDGVRGVSMGIESVVEESNSRSSGFRDNAIVWMQNQLRQNQTQDIILRYVNQLCDRMPSPMGESAVDCKSLS